MTHRRILIVDDEADICLIIKFNLEQEGYEADVAHSAEEALRLEIGKYDLLLLDVMMEGMSGFEMARRLKENPGTAKIPIIFVTAKDNEEDILRGFDAGSDDYISKPFSIKELVSRVNAVLRRTYGKQEASAANALHIGDLSMDLDGKTAILHGDRLDLTKTEFEMLRLLASHPGMVYSRDDILRTIWPDDVIVLGRTVDVNITRLRRKMGDYGAFIVTRHGYGYCFDAGGKL